jgi:hypothetical protein
VLIFYCVLLTVFCLGICLDPAAEDRRVGERDAALEGVTSDINTFWSDAHRLHAVVRLQDCAQHIEEVMEGCRRALTTMFSIMLPRNPFPANFHELLNIFKTSRRIHRLVELNMIAGANFALAWVRKWHPQLNFDNISQGLPPQRSRSTSMQAHMNATIEPTRRIIARLLEADAQFFLEHHYLNPLLDGPIDD